MVYLSSSQEFLFILAFDFQTFFRNSFSRFWWFFVRSCPSWNGRNNSVSPVEKRRAFGFYRNNNSGHNRCELLTLEIHFLESVWSSIGNETVARSGIAIVVPMKISEGARSFSKQHKTPYCFSHSSRRVLFEGSLLLDDWIFLWNVTRWFFKKTFPVKKPTLESTSENEEPSDSIGIIIAVIIDVNYWLWKLIS